MTTSNKTDKLRECPFCGSERVGMECSAGGIAGREATYNVRCHVCMASCAGYGSFEIATHHWNRRATDTALTHEREYAETFLINDLKFSSNTFSDPNAPIVEFLTLGKDNFFIFKISKDGVLTFGEGVTPKDAAEAIARNYNEALTHEREHSEALRAENALLKKLFDEASMSAFRATSKLLDVDEREHAERLAEALVGIRRNAEIALEGSFGQRNFIILELANKALAAHEARKGE